MIWRGNVFDYMSVPAQPMPLGLATSDLHAAETFVHQGI